MTHISQINLMERHCASKLFVSYSAATQRSFISLEGKYDGIIFEQATAVPVSLLTACHLL